jgi:Tol biopolymer transport system component
MILPSMYNVWGNRRTGITAASSSVTGLHPDDGRAPLDRYLRPSEVLACLERILADPLFQSSNQISGFLRFTVESTLAGKSDELKEYVIGVEVLKRAADYNPREDPGVGIVAGRLRSRLAEYYQGAGQADAVLIRLPKGSYVPTFERRANGALAADTIPTETREPATTSIPRITPRLAITVAGVLALFTAVMSAWLSASRTGLHVPLTPVPLTSYPGQEVEPSFSPDGKQVAFSWNGQKEDNYDIYVKQIGRDAPIRLTTDPAKDFSPAWSPDGRTIAFGRLLTATSSGLFLIPATGGPERKLAEIVAPAAFRARPYAAWSPDGRWLAFADTDSDTGGRLAPTGSTPASLFAISVETGEKRRLTSHPADSVGDSGPAFAPDGHALAFIRTQTVASSNLYLLPLSRNLTPEAGPRSLTSWKAFTNSPSWTPDGKGIIVASGPWGRLQLWRVDEAGKSSPRPLDFQASHMEDAAVSRHGQLAYSQKSTDINIWRTTLDRPGVIGNSPARFIASTMVDVNPQYSPDGKHIVFMSDRGGSRELWLCNEDGSNTVQLTSMRAPLTGGPRWSPDSSRILFDSNPEGLFQLYSISSSGGPVTRMTNAPADQAYGAWSPDARWIYFMSSRSGRRQIFKMPADGGEPIQVTKNGGAVPFPSADGKFLCYSERAGQREQNGMGGLRRIRLADGQDEPVLPSVTFWNVALVPEGIYYIPRADSEGHHGVYFFDFRTAKSSVVTRLSGAVSEGMAVSPEGHSLLFSQIDEQRSDLMLVENFR